MVIILLYAHINIRRWEMRLLQSCCKRVVKNLVVGLEIWHSGFVGNIVGHVVINIVVLAVVFNVKNLYWLKGCGGDDGSQICRSRRVGIFVIKLPSSSLSKGRRKKYTILEPTTYKIQSHALCRILFKGNCSTFRILASFLLLRYKIANFTMYKWFVVYMTFFRHFFI